MSVCLWDLVQSAARPQQQYNQHSEFVVGLEWSMFDEGVVASCGWDNMLHVWHKGTHPVVPPRPAPPTPQTSAASPVKR